MKVMNQFYLFFPLEISNGVICDVAYIEEIVVNRDGDLLRHVRDSAPRIININSIWEVVGSFISEGRKYLSRNVGVTW